ncbi:MAG TPA: HEAT repeat domain-containing protein [Phycisphaerae bacterium]|nr:HEAT repeat domain-containing protein [Phycisphaerae bacterium]
MMRRILPAVVLAGLAGAWVTAVSCGATPPSGPATELDRAVAAMRKVAPADFGGDEKKAKAKGEELAKAWKTILGAGPAGNTRLKQEIARLDAAKEKDDFFKLGAAVVLWQASRLKEAGTIAALWAGDVDLASNPNYVFYTAFDAAATQDERALPMLTAILGDHQGSVFVAPHSMTVVWPLTHEFLWGAFGSKGLPALVEVLRKPPSTQAAESAVFLLAKAQYLPALPIIRGLARKATPDGGEVRLAAVVALGVFGHPQDYDLLAAGLESKDALHYAAALYEYGDLRAVPHLVPLLASDDVPLRQEVESCLACLLTPAGLEALYRQSTAAKEPKERDVCAKMVTGILEPLDLDWPTYAARPDAEKAKLLASVRQQREAKYRSTPSDRSFTHDDLLKAAAEWQQNRRVTGGTYEWVQDRHALAATTPADIPLLLDVKAKCYTRLSDECLYETRVLDTLIRRLGRSRYRQVVGVTEKVESP